MRLRGEVPRKRIHQEADQDLHEPPGAAISGQAVPWHAFAQTAEWYGAIPREMCQSHQAGGRVCMGLGACLGRGRRASLRAPPLQSVGWLDSAGLLLAGDVEPNPGPRQRRAIFAVTDLAVGDVTQLTATRYATELRSFEGYLGVRGLQLESLLLEADIGAVVMQAGKYLRVSRHGRALRIPWEHLYRHPKAATAPLPAHRRACDRCAFHTGALVEVDEGLPSGGAARVPCASARHCGSGCGNVGLGPAGD